MQSCDVDAGPDLDACLPCAVDKGTRVIRPLHQPMKFAEAERIVPAMARYAAGLALALEDENAEMPGKLGCGCKPRRACTDDQDVGCCAVHFSLSASGLSSLPSVSSDNSAMQ